MSDTQLVNLRTGAEYDVRIDRRSKWGNPFVIGRDGTREEVIARYEQYLYRDRPDLLAALPELRGLRLACWCTPQPCHGDVLIRLLGEQPHGEAGGA